MALPRSTPQSVKGSLIGFTLCSMYSLIKAFGLSGKGDIVPRTSLLRLAGLRARPRSDTQGCSCLWGSHPQDEDVAVGIGDTLFLANKTSVD